MTSSPKHACVTLVLVVFVSLACGQATQCSPSHTQPKLRFVAQLSVNGCPIFVHDTGANDGPHLAVEPLMCVAQRLHNVAPQYDPINQLIYVGVPVKLRDAAILTTVEHQLQHLSPKSVKFANVSAMSASMDESSAQQFVSSLLDSGFYWSPDESSGTIMIWCERGDWCTIGFVDQVLKYLLVVAVIEVNGTSQHHSYSLSMQNHSLIDSNIRSSRYSDFPTCNRLQFFRSIHLTNCHARVHRRLDINGHFVIEPLFCPNITSFTTELALHDSSRGMFYLNLDLVLQDDVTLGAVRGQLAHLSPLNVSFMRLWRAEIVAASILSRRFQIGTLMVSGDWRSGQVRVYCRTMGDCDHFRSMVMKDPSDLLRYVRWTVTSVLTESDRSFDRILCKSVARISATTQSASLPHISLGWNQVRKLNCSDSHFNPCKLIVTRDKVNFVVIHQRLTGSFSFAQEWTEYERGFGDETEFWIGLSTIHWLSIDGVTFRIEVKLMNGSQHHQEYAGFEVGDASTNYTMTCGGIIVNRSSDNNTMMTHLSGMQFSTMDRDNDKWNGSCSTKYGNGGWWFKDCFGFYPTNVKGSDVREIWLQPVREIRLMLQI